MSTEKMYENILFENKEGIAKITFNRPEKYNALTMNMLLGLDDAITRIQNDSTVRVLVITGTGKAFIGGGNIKDYEEPSIDVANKKLKIINQVIINLSNLELPVISAVNGHAIGAGFNLALSGDLVISSDKAKFIQGFTRIGLVPDAVGTYFLPRLIGMAKAKELIFTNRALSAKEAFEMGLVNKVVNDDVLKKEVQQIARQLSQTPTYAIGIAKKLLNKSMDHDLQTALDYEAYGQNLAMGSNDHKEAVKSILYKSTPEYVGK